MRDPVSTELISAYLDGELTDPEERKLFDRLLAESEEYRELLKQQEVLRAELQGALSVHSAPPHLHGNILAAIEAAKPANDEPPAESRVEPAPQKRVSWKTMAIAAAALAAAVTALLLLPGPQPPIEPSRPGRAVPVHLAAHPQMTMVYEITLTQAGADHEVFKQILDFYEIGLDPTMRMDPNVDADLIALRGLDAARIEPYRAGTQSPVDGVPQDVEVVYISGNILKVGKLCKQLRDMVNSPKYAGREISQCETSLVFGGPQLDVMRKLHSSARDHFALTLPAGPAEEAFAFKLNFDVRLVSFGVAGTASLAAPQVGVDFSEAGVEESTNIGETDPDQDPDEPAHKAKHIDRKSTGQVLIFVRRPQAE